ncbi:AraC family transcriptional regulator [Paenibacillus sp. WQ 127069]|uniref:AraC family transcriptional regulator n=1 Tax=Paenibacillus baimaensis TaxID=2982185 RepID=A0ABT2UHN9_9BACL|nr:AraC family transcriptional regulator [Paenibacillus sp. WQ 127069]MCU6794161.1 AraC family transcriptional regulator [Paenibacillus sp. WQ 127069]
MYRVKLPNTQNKLFLKILLYFLSLLIPIVIIGLIVFFNVDQLIKKEVSEKLVVNLKSSSKTIDVYLGMAQSTNNNLLISDVVSQTIKPYSVLTDQEKASLPFIVRAIAANQNMVSSFIDNIFLYIDDEKVYTSEGAINFETFFDKSYHLDAYNKEYWRQRIQQSGFFELLPPSMVSRYAESSNKMVIPSVTTQYLNGKLAAMVTMISVQSIMTTLTNNSLFPSTAYVIIDKNNHTLLNGGAWNESTIQQIRNLFEQGPVQTVYAKVDQTQSMIVRISSDTYGWDYYSITPTHSFNNESSSILSLIWWICISLVVIGILFSFRFSVNIYNPIKNIRDILLQSEKGSQIGSGRDEFQVIGSRIHQLVQQNYDTNQKLSMYSNELLDQFFSSLIKGNPWTQKKPMKQMIEEIGFQSGTYLCCCFLFQYKERFYHDIVEADRLMIIEKMKKVLQGIMQQYVNSYLMEHDQNLYVCVVNLKQDNERASLNRALETIKQTFEYDMIYCELIIGLGKPYSKVNDVKKSYSDAVTAMQSSRNSEMSIRDATDLAIEQNYYYSFLDENKVVNALKSGDLELLITEVEGLIRINQERGVSYTYLGALLAELFNTGNRYLTERQVSTYSLLTEEDYTALTDKNMSPYELADRTRRLFIFYEQIITETVVKPERKAVTVISLITSHIENNYAKDLYLESIADEIGLSSKYISRIFKEITGTSITDYISLIRMSKAKEMLLNTDLKIGDIAQQIGIESRTTFLRIFKKHEGISPMDYRNAHYRKDA